MTSQKQSRPDIDAVLSFFDSIGIQHTEEPNVKTTFTDHLEIKKGVIHFDYEKVRVVDLLHDGGHLALILEEYRHLFSGNLIKGFNAYIEHIHSLNPLDERLDILMCCNDIEVTAWAWAVGVKLGLNHEDIIPDENYGGGGSGVRLSLQLSSKSPMPYIGVSRLHYAGYSQKYNRRVADKNPQELFYPNMFFWTVDQALTSKGFSTKLVEA